MQASWELSRRHLEREKDAPATLLDSSWPLLARPGCPKIGSGAAFGRPKAAPSASGRVPETVLGVRDGPRSIFLRFWGDLARIFVNFRISFRRFSLEPSATKRQIRKLKKESCGPHRPTWLLRCAVASCCSYVFRSDRRTLHVRPCVIAYPQAHLVIFKRKSFILKGNSLISKCTSWIFERISIYF